MASASTRRAYLVGMQILTTIIGAGLCGLAIAYRLKQAGLPVIVLEAGETGGGRIKPAGIQNHHHDLGATWVWPHAQPIVTQWIEELGLKLFEQFDSGTGLLDRKYDECATQHLLPSQQGSYRIVGGTHALTRHLESQLSGMVHCQQTVKHCQHIEQRWQLSVSCADGLDTLRTDRLVIATPPRLAARFFTENTDSLKQVLPILQASETWMAPHAKVVIFYDKPFWRAIGFSGRIASRVGPLVEVHDHCGPHGTHAALFGFAGVPADMRKQAGEQFIDAIKMQMQRCFGGHAPAPIKIQVKDWAFEPFTSTEEDRHSSGAHPPVLDSLVRQAYCNDSLWFAGSETSAVSAGLIEGALARADVVAQQIVASTKALNATLPA